VTTVSNFFTDAFAVVIVLGLMIFFHELGHFMAAKSIGVRVLTFSFGFGKRLFGFKRGDTDYRVSALPFGGYVKMAGDDPSQPHTGDPGEFLARPRWQRFYIVVAGPLMNVVLAVGLLAVLYHYHYERPAYAEQAARVGAIEPDSPAAAAGIQPGDLIVQLGDIHDPKWEDIEFKIPTAAGETLPLEVERAGQRLHLTLKPRVDTEDQVGYAGWAPYVPAVIGKVEPGYPGEKAGLQSGDRLVAINGEPIYYSPDVVNKLQQQDGKPVDFTVLRNGQQFHLTIKPVYTDMTGTKKWMIGILFHSDTVVEQLPWGKATGASLDFNLRNSLLTFQVIGKILSRRMSPKTLSGPISIAQISGEAYRAGLPDLVFAVSLISLQLAIFNLLPIPILDGGVILLLGLEAVMRRDLSIAFKERFVQVGLAVLLLLAVFVMYNDLVRTFHTS
jgi:regulator of sigma E protease